MIKCDKKGYKIAKNSKNNTPIKAIVTGGAGFIGSYMVDLLLKNNYEVTIIDNLANSSIKNIEKYGKKVKFLQIDISDYNINLDSYFQDIDFVFHFAALADIVPSITNPLKYHKTNVDGTIRILEASRKSTKLKKFIYSASSSCYGIPDIYPTPEHSPINPQYPYAHTKAIAEQYVMHWGNIYNMPVISLRFFNVYGVGHKTNGTYGAVFGVFLAQLANNKPLTIVGDGKQKRDFTYVGDIVDAVFTASISDTTQEIFNVGSSNCYEINYLAKLLNGKKEYIAKRPAEPEMTFGDTAKIQKILKWSAKMSFEEGVAIMLKNINKYKNAPLWNKDSIDNATKQWFKYLQK